MKGLLLANRYAVLDFLGGGTYGSVYLAQDRVTYKYVAVKAPISTEEASLLRCLVHPNIPKYYYHECSVQGPRVKEKNFLVMDWIDGTVLDDLCKVEKFAWNAFVSLIAQFIEVNQYLLIQKIRYKDMHLRNMMYMKDGKFYLIDFGIVEHCPPERDIVGMVLIDVLYCIKDTLLPCLENALQDRVYAWCKESLQDLGNLTCCSELLDRWHRAMLPKQETSAPLPPLRTY